MKSALLFSIILVAACKPMDDEVSQTQSKETYVWFKDPALIRNTVIKTWGIRISREDDLFYFSLLGQLYGAVDRSTGRVLLREPNGTYVLALDLVSLWLSELLLTKQIKYESGAQGSNAVFHGQIGFSLDNLPDREACFADSTRDWCDADDKITTGLFSAKDKERLRNASSERKRLMHNIQDIGDYLGVTIDNLLPTDSKHAHAPQYLLDEVFIPNLDAGDPNSTACCDIRAWQQVVHSILMSGPFFMYLPSRSL